MNSNKYSNLILKYGIGAGLVMGMILLMFEWFSYSNEVFLKYINYSALVLFLLLAVNRIRKTKKKRADLFIQGIKVGSWISMVAGIVVVSLNIFLFMFSPDLTFNKYFVEPDSILKVMTISTFLFLEILVLGSLLSFFILQYQKKQFLQ